MAEHLHIRGLHHSKIVSISEVCCRPHSPEPSEEEFSATSDIVFPRTGVFVRHSDGDSVVADCNRVLFFNGGELYRVSHPVPGGDDCTVFSFSTDLLLDSLSRYEPAVRERPQRPFPFGHGPNHPETCLLYQRLRQYMSTAGRADLAVDEFVIYLLDRVVDQAHQVRGLRRRRTHRGTPLAHRSLADATRTVLASTFQHALALDAVARRVHSSPYHLARVFKREVGLSIHQYRNRLRLRASLDRLATGRLSLAELALQLGYSSHSHYSAAFRAEFGISPSAFRRTATIARLREMSRNLTA